MPHGHPVVSGEFMHDPIAAKSANTAVLFTSERAGWRVIHAVVIDVGHPGLHPQREPQATVFVLSEYGA